MTRLLWLAFCFFTGWNADRIIDWIKAKRTTKHREG
nr:MAG TPA: PROTEIN (HEMOLYTIC POLYPEPTIDE) [Caudoviricetes sp.]